MLETFGISNFGIGICLGFRAWNFVFEAELCSGAVHLRLVGGDETDALSFKPDRSATFQGRAIVWWHEAKASHYIFTLILVVPPFRVAWYCPGFKVVRQRFATRPKPRTTLVDPAGKSPRILTNLSE